MLVAEIDYRFDGRLKIVESYDPKHYYIESEIQLKWNTLLGAKVTWGLVHRQENILQLNPSALVFP